MGRAYEAAFEDAPIAMWCYDIDSLRFLAANRAVVSRYGWTADELRSMTVQDLLQAEEVPRFEQLVAGYVQDDSPRRGQWQFRTRLGEVVDVETVSHQIEFAGHAARMVLVSDITADLRLAAEREAALEAARTSERRLEVLLQNSAELVAIVSSDDEVIYLSESKRSPLLGNRGPDLSAGPFDWIHGDSLAQVVSMQQESLAHPGVFFGPRRFQVHHPDGVRWVESTWVGMADDPAVGGVLSHTRDVTGQVEAEMAQRRIEERFRLLVEQSDEAILVVKRGGELVYASPNLDRLLGLTAANFLEKATYENVHPDDRERFVSAVLQTTTGDPHPTRIEIRMRFGDEWRVLDMVLRDLSDLESVGGLVFNVRDVTERRRVELQYFRAQKMEAVGRLVGGVAHDFNNILTAVVGHAQLLLETAAPGSPDAMSAQAILESGWRAVDLTAQLLAVTRHRLVEPQDLDLNAAIRKLMPMIEPTIGEDVRVVLELATERVIVRADPGRLDQVLLNLVVNARDALPEGGRVVIRTAVIEDDDGDRHALLTVADDGIGMDQSVLDRLFEPFFTTKGEGLGTGLGLATVYAIIDQAGGSIEVESAQDEGATFLIHLPLVTLDDPAEDALAADTVESTGLDPDGGSTPDPSAGAPWRKGSTILLVEDEDLVRTLASRSLTEAGFAVLEADSVAAAVDVASTWRLSIHLVVTDVVLADGRASHLVARLSDHCPDVPVLYVSGYPLDTMVESGEVAPGVEFLSKPYLPDQLVRRVKALLPA
ncbi:MAG: PAS domain-containing hybrid sensor histidine kinase/response regulator [Acidimicrobiales bacterium]